MLAAPSCRCSDMGFLVAAWLRLAGLGFLLDIAAVQVLEFLGVPRSYYAFLRISAGFRIDFGWLWLGLGWILAHYSFNSSHSSLGKS